ncbi:hypothetical protein CDD83_10479 [Cordyceps sp. RAO-2017]|nr:hypothetical protein CDD83_10479 [Cordyceps sp. RAO-2017]
MAVSPRLSPLTVLVGALLLVSSSVCAAAAVLGVDLGNGYIKAALVKPGIPLDIVLTKDSRRKETSAVAFKPSNAAPKEGVFPERSYGADAMAIAPRFPGEVYPNLKTLLGLLVDDPAVQEYASRHPSLQLKAHPSRGTVAFQSSTLPAGSDAWMVEELLAMELQSIQKNAEAAAADGSTVRSIVLTVPPFYTAEEKRAVQNAAELAGLKVLGLVSDGLAIGLNYATSRQFPNINEGAKPEYHMVFDMGAGSTSATILRFQGRTVKDVGKFNKTVQEVQVVGAGWDRSLGGDSLNNIIVDDMISRFVQSPEAKAASVAAVAVKSHGRTMAKLVKEAERVRHVLSANQETYASFEGLYEDIDFKYKLTRADFEKMTDGYAERVSSAIQRAIDMSQLGLGELTSVILHGGASRTPFVQRALEQLVGSADKLRSNVNADEAAVFGAGFRAAELSPSFRVKEIRISEGPMYPTGLKWTAGNGKPRRQRLWTATSPMGGPAKEMTWSEDKDFSISFYQQVGSEDREVKVLSTKNLTATVAAMKERYPSCIESDIAFRVGMKLSSENGEVQVVKAAVECEAEVPAKEGFVDGVKNLLGFGKKDQQQQQPLKDADEGKETTSSAASSEASSEAKPSESSTEASTEASTADGKPTPASSGDSSQTSGAPSESGKDGGEAKPEVKKKEMVSIPVAYSLEKGGIPSLSRTELNKAKDRLKSFAASDKARVQREEALNQLEGFAYKVRDLLDNEAFVARSTEQERSKLAEKASEMSEWLYDGGAEATKEELKAKLKLLQDLVTPVQTRIDEAEKRPGLVASLKSALNQTALFVDGLRKQISEYEEGQAAASASAGGSSTASSAPSASASGDFDGLEDEDDTAQKEGKASKAEEKAGPIPPLYKKEEVEAMDTLRQSTLKWLSELEARQEALPPTADPVLLSKEVMDRQQKLDKAGMDLALKGMRNFENKAKKASKKASKKKTQTKSAGEAKSTGKGGPTDEQLESLLETVKKMEAERKDKDKDKEGVKEKEGAGEQKKKHDEL